MEDNGRCDTDVSELGISRVRGDGFTRDAGKDALQRSTNVAFETSCASGKPRIVSN